MIFVTATTNSVFKALGPFRIESSGSIVMTTPIKIEWQNLAPVQELEIDTVIEDLYDSVLFKECLEEPGKDISLDQLKLDLGLR